MSVGFDSLTICHSDTDTAVLCADGEREWRKSRQKSMTNSPLPALAEKLKLRFRMRHQLDFEKPITELQNKLEELRKHQEAHSLNVNFKEEVAQIEKKIAETRKQIFSNLTAWQRVQLARHPKRPYTLNYLETLFSDFSELHGDRLFGED